MPSFLEAKDCRIQFGKYAGWKVEDIAYSEDGFRYLVRLEGSAPASDHTHLADCLRVYLGSASIVERTRRERKRAAEERAAKKKAKEQAA